VYDPTIMDSYDKIIQYEDEIFKIHVLDTAGQDEYKSLRPEFMRAADVFLCVFDISTKSSLGVLEQYISEIRLIKGDSFKIVIVGNKSDLDRGDHGVTKDEGQEFAKKFDAPYIETSALKREGIDEAFELAVSLYRGKKKVGGDEHNEEKKPKIKKKGGFFESISQPADDDFLNDLRK
jgi:GTPase KRas protein